MSKFTKNPDLNNVTTMELWDEAIKKGPIDMKIDKNSKYLINKNVADYLNKLLKEKEMSKSDLINRLPMSSSYVYQLLDGRKKNPSRNRLLTIAFAMKLNIEQTDKLLKIANLGALYPRDQRDFVIIYCINNSMSIEECTDILDQQDFAPIVDDID